MRHIGVFSVTPTLLVAALFAACNGPAPILQFSPSSLNLGRVALTARTQGTLTLTNVSDQEATLGEISEAALGLSSPFTLLPESTCATGAVLPVDGTCTLSIGFAPESEGNFEQMLNVAFESNAAESGSGTASALVSGVGFLDCAYEPDHPLCPEDRDLAFSVSPELNFGSVDILTVASRVVTVTNIDVDDVTTLGEISDAALGLDGQFTLLPGTTCTTGMELAPNGGNCELVIQYRPSANAYQRDTLVLSYVEPAGTPIETIDLRLVGFGNLNCALDPGLAAARQQGVDEANARNATEAARGRADGEALTHEDGRRQGYTEAYSSAYESSYRSAYDSNYRSAYDTAYRSSYDANYIATYSDRYTQLVTDTTVCSRGDSDGRAAGRLAGRNDGSYEGYNDGYWVGYPLGQDDGYPAGIYASEDNCYADGGVPVYDPIAPFPGFDWEASRSRGGERPSPADPAFVNGCHMQGYNATYNPNSYANAYAAAAAANPQYQAGLRDGRTQGTNDGNRDGAAAGVTAGRLVGTSDGNAQGRSDGIAQALFDAERDAEPVRQAIYINCYDSAYAAGYSNQYYTWYDIEYDNGYYAGYDDGYDSSYYAGYRDVVCCYGSSCYRPSASPTRLAAGQLTRGRGARYGQGKDWWVATGREGVMGDRFVRSQLPLWLSDLIGPERSADLRARAESSRGMNIREALREEKRLAPPSLSSRRR